MPQLLQVTKQDHVKSNKKSDAAENAFDCFCTTEFRNVIVVVDYGEQRPLIALHSAGTAV